MRINSAADDAAGLTISEKLRAQTAGLGQASRNAQDGISMIQTGEGALNETASILQRMRELTVQGGNDTLQASDRGAIKSEMDQLSSEINRISDTTQFNGITLLNGSLSAKGTRIRLQQRRRHQPDGLHRVGHQRQRAGCRPGGGPDWHGCRQRNGDHRW